MQVNFFRIRHYKYKKRHEIQSSIVFVLLCLAVFSDETELEPKHVRLFGFENLRILAGGCSVLGEEH